MLQLINPNWGWFKFIVGFTTLHHYNIYIQVDRERGYKSPFVDLQMTSETESHRAQLQAGTVRSATHLYTLGEGERGKEVG